MTNTARIILLVAAVGMLAVSACRSAEPAARSQPAARTPPASRNDVTSRFAGRDVHAWRRRKVGGKDCLVSPVQKAPAGHERNHHRLTVRYKGKGPVQLGVVHSGSDNLTAALAKKHLFKGFRPAASGKEIRLTSPYKGERFSWICVAPAEGVEIAELRYTCWQAKGTLYGHVARRFEFGGAKQPYRLMYPRNYDPKKAYPLVISGHGSGGVGADNARSMEMVNLARYLFTQYYFDAGLECFSLVPQIPSSKTIPSPYFPKGPRGGPTIYHPSYSAVNENNWHVQATLALVQSLIKDEKIHIDADRVYYAGFSYGGRACWEYLKAGRSVFAAGMSAGGWPIGKPYSDPKGEFLDRLKLEVSRYKHIPVYVLVGAKDKMRFGSKAVHREMLAAGGKSSYVEFPKTEHIPSARKAWGNRKHIAWLFAQNRKNNPPAGKDPFPGGAYGP